MAVQFTGLASGLDTQSIVADIMAVERMKVTNIEKNKAKVEMQKDAWSEMNTKLYSFYKEELFSFKTEGTYSQKSLKSSNESVISLNDGSDATNGSHSIEVVNMAKGSFVTGNEINASSQTTADELFDFTGSVTINIKTNVADGFGVDNEITILETDTIEDITNKIKDLGLDLDVNFDEGFKRLFISSEATGEAVQLSVTGNGNSDAESLLGALGLTVAGGVVEGNLGVDAKFNYNGTELTNASNKVTLNGLDFTINADTGTSTIAVATDTDAVYDKVSAFITKYNELMGIINTKLDVASARGYEPLTADEKDAMSDSEVELWENKIKNALLRNDSTLRGIRTDMRSRLTTSSGIDNTDLKYKYLSDLGIVTGNYTEKGQLHIHGDEDDDLYSLKTNRLREAIENNPDDVMKFLTAIGKDLYDNMAAKMSSNSVSSALTFYGNKSMDDKVKSYDEDILKLEERLAAVEARYYRQFTAMEKAMQSSNSTGNWLSQQLGSL